MDPPAVYHVKDQQDPSSKPSSISSHSTLWQTRNVALSSILSKDIKSILPLE
jgi:hypothetical protein